MRYRLKPIEEVSGLLDNLELKYRGTEILQIAYDILDILKQQEKLSQEELHDLIVRFDMLESSIKKINHEIVMRELDRQYLVNDGGVDFGDEIVGSISNVILNLVDIVLLLLDLITTFRISTSGTLKKYRSSSFYMDLSNLSNFTITNPRYNSFYSTFIANSPNIWRAFSEAKRQIEDGNYTGAFFEVESVVIYLMEGLEA